MTTDLTQEEKNRLHHRIMTYKQEHGVDYITAFNAITTEMNEERHEEEIESSIAPHGEGIATWE